MGVITSVNSKLPSTLSSTETRLTPLTLLGRVGIRGRGASRDREIQRSRDRGEETGKYDALQNTPGRPLRGPNSWGAAECGPWLKERGLKKRRRTCK